MTRLEVVSSDMHSASASAPVFAIHFGQPPNLPSAFQLCTTAIGPHMHISELWVGIILGSKGHVHNMLHHLIRMREVVGHENTAVSGVCYH